MQLVLRSVGAGQSDRQEIFETDRNDTVLLSIASPECFCQTLNSDTQHNEFIDGHFFTILALASQLFCELWRKIEAHLRKS